jgi:hypothetical protein
MTLRDIFFIRMQRINNFLRFKRKYKNKKGKFTFLNFRLLKNLNYFKQTQSIKQFNTLLKNKNLNISLIQKVIFKLSLFKIKLHSNLVYKFIEIYFINKKIPYIFYGPI